MKIGLNVLIEVHPKALGDSLYGEGVEFASDFLRMVISTIDSAEVDENLKALLKDREEERTDVDDTTLVLYAELKRRGWECQGINGVDMWTHKSARKPVTYRTALKREGLGR